MGKQIDWKTVPESGPRVSITCDDGTVLHLEPGYRYRKNGNQYTRKPLVMRRGQIPPQPVDCYDWGPPVKVADKPAAKRSKA